MVMHSASCADSLYIVKSQRNSAGKFESRPRMATFGDIYKEHFDFVWRSVKRLGISDALMDDVVQDIFLVVHRKLPEFQGRSTIKTWLFGIVLRVVSGYRRTARRKPSISMIPDSIKDTKRTNPLESAAKSEAVEILYKLLDSLDDEKREVFVLAELEQMTIQEIADTMGFNVNTVYSRLRAARQAFERAVQRYNASDGWRYK